MLRATVLISCFDLQKSAKNVMQVYKYLRKM
nr:MAG TPA: hypothetical protein [Caudoviricetes sp.]